MLSFFKQLADLTDNSNSSTFLRRFLLNGRSSIISVTSSSSGSSKFIKFFNWTYMILAEKATASSGVTEPSVVTTNDNLS